MNPDQAATAAAFRKHGNVITPEQAGCRCVFMDTFGHRCPNGYGGTLTTGCVHEHICTFPACTRCYQSYRATGPWYCLLCEESAQPHLCPVQELRWQPA